MLISFISKHPHHFARPPPSLVKTQRYQMFLDDGRKFLAAARRRKGSASSHYDVTTSQSAGAGARYAPGFVGKLRANFIGTEFILFDGSVKPGAAAAPMTVGGSSLAVQQPRQELAAITYEPNILGTKGPRKMTVAVPVNSAQQRQESRARNSMQQTVEAGSNSSGSGADSCSTPLLERLKSAAVAAAAAAASDAASDHPGHRSALAAAARDTNGLVLLRNKQPRWNEAMRAFCLNFGGRVLVASVKNFQLVTAEDPDTVVLQFGKVGDETFTCDFRWPLTALQAFAICLSSFDSKLACE